MTTLITRSESELKVPSSASSFVARLACDAAFAAGQADGFAKGVAAQTYRFIVEPENNSEIESPEFDQLLDELAADPVYASELPRARAWVAEAFYPTMTLSALRLRAGMSQRQLAEACGMEQPHISRMESGKHEPHLMQIRRISQALGVSMDEFASAWENSRAALNEREDV
ncbi:MAG TPA: helix-turn-helix transcriptional regulator [Burkholderiaceae bacterium]